MARLRAVHTAAIHPAFLLADNWQFFFNLGNGLIFVLLQCLLISFVLQDASLQASLAMSALQNSECALVTPCFGRASTLCQPVVPTRRDTIAASARLSRDYRPLQTSAYGQNTAIMRSLDPESMEPESMEDFWYDGRVAPASGKGGGLGVGGSWGSVAAWADYEKSNAPACDNCNCMLTDGQDVHE